MTRGFTSCLSGLSKVPARLTDSTIKRLSPVDLFRPSVLRPLEGPNRACPLPTLARGADARLWPFHETFPPDRKRTTWALWQDRRLTGLVSARQRSGPASWEVIGLATTSNGADNLAELLDKAAESVAAAGAQRLFLRLRRDDPILDPPFAGGFFPCFSEVLFKRPPRPFGGRRASSGDSHLRPREPADDHDLFRLYNLTTPAEVRKDVGMTFDQWKASREPGYGVCDELVLDTGEGIKGLLRTMRTSGTGQLEAAVHPDQAPLLANVVDCALDRLGKKRSLFCLVPQYDTSLGNIMTERGFHAVSLHVVLVRALAIKAEEDARVRATVTSS